MWSDYLLDLGMDFLVGNIRPVYPPVFARVALGLLLSTAVCLHSEKI